MSKNLYGSDTSLITAGIIHDETEGRTQDLINADQKKNSVYYGVCSTAANTQQKAVTISGITALYDGLKVRIKFENGQTSGSSPTLKINSLDAWPISTTVNAMAAQYEWTSGEVIDLVYDESSHRWLMSDAAHATQVYYGKTKLSNSVSSSSDLIAASSSAVKTVNDKVGDGVLDSGFTATNLTGAANELKNSLNQLETTTAQLDQNMAYVESGNTASRTYVDGDFISWKGTLYTASGTIASGTSFTTGSGGNLAAVVDGNNNLCGGLNNIKNSMLKYKEVEIPLSTLGSSFSPTAKRIDTCTTLFGVAAHKIFSIRVRNTAFTPATNMIIGMYNDDLYIATTQTSTLSSSGTFGIIYND